MKKEYFIAGIDSSTSSVRAAVYSNNGKEMFSVREPVSLYSPKPDHYEQNAPEWWTSVRKVLKKITGTVDPEKIKSVSVSNQRETFMPLNRDGDSLRPDII
jgi:xylulokinase